jgi:alpha-galactosidase
VTGSVPLPGLDPEKAYAVRVRSEAGLPAVVQNTYPAWWDRALDPEGLVVPGAVLTGVGLPVPVVGPAQGYLLDVRAV